MFVRGLSKQTQSNLESLKNASFVKNLVAGNKILSRKFYIVIPYHSEDKHDMGLVKEQLNLTKDLVSKGLEKLGMRAKQLESIEILDLFYSFYNPNQFKTQELTGETIRRLLN